MALQGQAVYSRNDPDHPVPYGQVLPTVAYEPCICKENNPITVIIRPFPFWNLRDVHNGDHLLC